MLIEGKGRIRGGGRPSGHNWKTIIVLIVLYITIKKYGKKYYNTMIKKENQIIFFIIILGITYLLNRYFEEKKEDI